MHSIVGLLDQTIADLPLIGKSSLVTILRKLLYPAFGIKSPFPPAAQLSMKEYINMRYTPLKGDLDIVELEKELRDYTARFALNYKKNVAKKLSINMEDFYKPYTNTENNSNIAKLIRRKMYGNINLYEAMLNYYVHSYPRSLDRIKIVDLVQLTGYSFKIYGKGWETYPEYSNIYEGRIKNHRHLLSIYNGSMLNIANNTHGLGMHSRVLESMAVGGFIFSHKHEGDIRSGDLNLYFEEDEHYGLYSADNFIEKVNYWVHSHKKRDHAIESSRNIVYQLHTWDRRVQQILNDLSK
jgi:hypothetical protein